MQGRIPSDAEIEDAVRQVIRVRRRVESQRELCELVTGVLSESGEPVRLSPPRVRRVALKSGAASVEIDYRDSGRSELPEICPVCKGGMSPVRAMNLEGNIVEVRRNCTVCSYTVSGKTRMPSRYTFVRNSAPLTAAQERIRMLRRAASYLRMARKLMAEAVEGTGMQSRVDSSAEKIEEVISSKDDPGSVKNLVADLKDEGGPLWTRPLDSPKKARGKDI